MMLSSCGAVANAAGPYTLQIVAKTGDKIEGQTITDVAFPAINNKGTVAFAALFSGGEAFFTPSSLLVKPGDTIGGKTLINVAPTSIFGPFSINDNGTVGVLAGFSGGTGLFTQSALLAKAGDTIGGKTLMTFGNHPVLNNNGTALFLADFGTDLGLFTQSAVLAKPGDTIGGYTLTALTAFFGPPSLNNLGTAAFLAGFSGGTGLFTQSNVLVKTGDTIAGLHMTGFGSPDINDAGTIAFAADYTDGTGIFTQSAVLATIGGAIGGKTITNIDIHPKINNSGVVVFGASFAGGSGIFTQSGLAVSSGETVDGKTLSSVASPVINDRGTIAFVGFFTDASVGVVTAQLFAGTPGDANCQGKSVSGLAQQYGGLPAAATALGYSNVQALQDAIQQFCQ